MTEPLTEQEIAGIRDLLFRLGPRSPREHVQILPLTYMRTREEVEKRLTDTLLARADYKPGDHAFEFYNGAKQALEWTLQKREAFNTRAV